MKQTWMIGIYVKYKLQRNTAGPKAKKKKVSKFGRQKNYQNNEEFADSDPKHFTNVQS